MARAQPDSAPTAAARNLKDLLPREAHVIFSEAHHAGAELHPLEQQFLSARRMQPVREREFRAGRALAREALARFGIENHPLLPGETREPLWPVGFVGSISHCDGVCAVAVAESNRFSGIGIDLERTGRIDDRIAETVCTPDERRQLETLESPSHRQRLSLLFSAKESVFKALFPLTRQLLEFHDVALAIGENHFTARAARPGVRMVEFLNGRFLFDADLTMTAAWLPAT